MHYIGKILPIEGYKVRLDGDLPSSYHHALSHLYQPLVGPKAIMLYHTLLNDLELKGSTALQTHHLLMNYLNCSLEQIYKARLKLEAIGLLKTFQQTKDGVKVYIYALQSPFSPEVFFKDAMLSELLYHHLGDQKFSQLKRLFIGTTDEKNQGEDITASFH